MKNFTAHVVVMPLKELLDPQGKAVSDTLGKMGNTNIGAIRIGKHITLQINAADEASAYQIAEDACKQMLYNPVMEQYQITIEN